MNEWNKQSENKSERVETKKKIAANGLKDKHHRKFTKKHEKDNKVSSRKKKIRSSNDKKRNIFISQMTKN